MSTSTIETGPVLVYAPDVNAYEPALEIEGDKRRGTVVIGVGATARSVYFPGDVPEYVSAVPSLIEANSAEQYEKHGFGD